MWCLRIVKFIGIVNFVLLPFPVLAEVNFELNHLDDEYGKVLMFDEDQDGNSDGIGKNYGYDIRRNHLAI